VRLVGYLKSITMHGNMNVKVHSLFQSEFSTESDPAQSRFLKVIFPLLPRLPVTSILPSISPSITCFRRQFLSKKWPIHL